MLLDDAEALKRIDRSGTLSLMERTPNRLAPPSDASSTCGKPFEKPANVVLGGVGGSGIAGDIVSDYCRRVTDVPVSVCRTLNIPKWVGKGTLFVAISYSGETRETIGQFDQARKQGAELAAIASGGELLSKVKDESVPYLRVPAGLPPRVALPELVAAVMFVLGSAKVLENIPRLLSEATKSVKAQIDQVKSTVPLDRNDAKSFAQALVDKLPLLIGDEEYGSVLRRFKNQINENAKMPAFYYTLPEGFHNDIEGLRTLSQLARVQPIVLRTLEELEGQKRTREQLVNSLMEMGFPSVIEFEGSGPDKLSRLLTAVTFGDFVSVYLAALRGVDPADLTLIPKFRAVMRGG